MSSENNNKGYIEGWNDHQNLPNCQPPSYNDVNRNQESYYQQQMVPGPSVIYVENFAPPLHNPPTRNEQMYPTIMTNSSMNPYSAYKYQRRAARLLKIAHQRIYLDEKYPTYFVIMHCIALFIMALCQIIPDFLLLSYNSFLSVATFGFYCGGLVIGCSILTACTSK